MKKYITDSVGTPTELSQVFVIDSTGKQHGMTNVEFVTTPITFIVGRSGYSPNYTYDIKGFETTEDEIDLIIPEYLTFYKDYTTSQMVYNTIQVAGIDFVTMATTLLKKIRSVVLAPHSNTISVYLSANISNGAFSGSLSLKSFELYGKTLLTGSQGLRSVFKGCANLEKVYIEDIYYSVINTYNTFYYCHLLKEVYIKHTTNTTNIIEGFYIDYYSFYQCYKLEKVTLISDKAVLRTVNIDGVDSIIPTTVDISRGDESFNGSSKLKDIILGQTNGKRNAMYTTSTSYNSIFSGIGTVADQTNAPAIVLVCNNLTSLNNTLSNGIFRSLEAYIITKTNIALSGGAASRGRQKVMFSYVYGVLPALTAISTLEEIKLFGNAITSIANNGFKDLPLLKRLYLGNNVPPVLGTGCFSGTTVKAGITIFVPVGCIPTYEAATGWSEFIGQYAEYVPEVYS